MEGPVNGRNAMFFTGSEGGSVVVTIALGSGMLTFIDVIHVQHRHHIFTWTKKNLNILFGGNSCWKKKMLILIVRYQ